jgi:hypothetical protein
LAATIQDGARRQDGALRRSGRRSPQFHTEGQVEVGTVDSPAHPATEKDAATLEAELTDKGFREGKASSPVAGYLYFPVLQRKKHTALELDYETNGSSVILQFSQK